MAGTAFLDGMKYLIHDGDGNFRPAFDYIVRSAGVDLVPLPPQSPSLNAYAERFVLSVKSECLWRILLFGERGLEQVLSEYAAHYHTGRNHQGVGSRLLFPEKKKKDLTNSGEIVCRERLGGLLKYYSHRVA